MKKKISFVAMLIGFAVVLTTCGGGGPSTTINVTMTDFHFEPGEFIVPAGQEITVNATNNGAVKHELVIFNLGTDAGTKFGDEDEGNIYWEVEVESGDSIAQTFTAPTEPGEYYVTCGVEGHLEAGMSGKLIVVAGE
ncbi:MAG: cupredoxin domain-containing protein [Anaerolineales bacterium]|nr:cupredoxin domain-containing protein [Anaerolineales bacterium]